MVRSLFWKTVVINDRRLFHLVSNQTDKKICKHNNYHRQGKRVSPILNPRLSHLNDVLVTISIFVGGFLCASVQDHG